MNTSVLFSRLRGNFFTGTFRTIGAGCLIGLLLGTADVHAQQLTGGLKGGVNLANLYVDEVDDENARFGFNAGLYLKAPVTGFFAIQPELLYSLQGAQVNYGPAFGVVGNGGKIRYNLSYVNLPVLAVVNVTRNFNLHAGPYAGLLAGVRVKDVDDDGSTNSVRELDRDDFNTLDYGLSGGLGIDFEDGTFGLRYNYGLNEIGRSGTRAGELMKNAKNSVFQLYAGFKF